MTIQGRVITAIFEDFNQDLANKIETLQPVLFEELPLSLEDLFEANLKRKNAPLERKNHMVKNIYLTRYSKILLPLIGLILLMFAFNAWSNIKNWHDTERYLTTDKELKADFNAYPEHYTYLDEKKQEHIPYASFEKYIEYQLYVYHKNDFSDKISQKTDPNQTYFNQSSNLATLFALFFSLFYWFLLIFCRSENPFHTLFI